MCWIPSEIPERNLIGFYWAAASFAESSHSLNSVSEFRVPASSIEFRRVRSNSERLRVSNSRRHLIARMNHEGAATCFGEKFVWIKKFYLGFGSFKNGCSQGTMETMMAPENHWRYCICFYSNQRQHQTQLNFIFFPSFRLVCAI